QADQPAVHPSLQLGISGQKESLVIHEGEDTFAIDQEETLSALETAFTSVHSDWLSAQENPVVFTPAVRTENSRQLTADQVEFARARAENIIGKKLVFEKDYTQKTLTDTQLISFLNLPEGYRADQIGEVLQTWA